MQASKDEILAKIAAGAARRKQKVEASNEAAELTRLENEARLVDIEADTGLTLGVDLGVVWLRSGKMVAVRRPPQIRFEKYQLKSVNGDITPKDIDDLLAAPTVVYPEPGFLEPLWSGESAAKFAAVDIVHRMCDIASKDFAGK